MGQSTMNKNSALWKTNNPFAQDERTGNDIDFRQTFQECCAEDVRALRFELLQRLAPAEKVERESWYWQMAMMETDPRFPQRFTYAPMPIRDYAEKLASMGKALLHRDQPEGLKKSLTYEAGSFPVNFPTLRGIPTPNGLEISIKDKQSLSSGFVVLLLEADPGSYELRWNDKQLSLSQDELNSSNRVLVRYLADHPNATLTICLRVNDIKFTTNSPLQIFLLSVKPAQVRAITFFGD